MVEDKIKIIKDIAHKNKVPIMFDDGLSFILKEINDNNLFKILEIGTAVGYSSIKMAEKSKKIKITTIERDKERYKEAVKNIKDCNLDDQITTILNDALEVNLTDKYDLIFIDAAKSKNKAIFDHFKNNLKKDGEIITDNLSFHGFVTMNPKDIKNRNTRQLVRKINEYINFLKENQDFNTTFYQIGDGLSVSKKRND